MNAPIKKTIAREFTFKFLYHYFIKENQNELNDLINSDLSSSNLDEEMQAFKASFSEPDTEHPDNNADDKMVFIARIFIVNTLKNWKTLEEKISENLKGWTLEKLDKVDRCILMASAAELHYTEETAPEIIIDEAIKMAKKFGSKESSAFINGVLDAMAKKL